MTPYKQLELAAQMTFDLYMDRHGHKPAYQDPEMANCILMLGEALRKVAKIEQDASNKPSLKELFDPVFGGK